MNTFKKLTLVMTALVMILAVDLFADDVASDLMKKAHLNMFYAEDDGLAEVNMSIVNSSGKERIREFAMLRLDNEEGGEQKYYTYFRKPHDVARLTFMVHKNPVDTDQRWLYVPAVDLVKRISADDKGSSFVGSDFSYEDVSGRHWSEDNHKIVEEKEYNGKQVYVIESVPKAEDGIFGKKHTYIDKETMLPIREEYYDDKGELERIFTAEKIEVIEDVPTVTVRKMENVQKEQHTIVEFSSIDYNVGVDNDIFTERFLKNPPRKYIK
ncbi:MAG: outer membrane lipoprotein-sorting protein [candidate division Zixibacteria bacterium]|nr:outer membrane lipoprotein-sorting protein [candidate division Zixibacteria bacterium]